MKSKLSLTKKVLVKLTDVETNRLKGGVGIQVKTKPSECNNSPLCMSEPACSEEQL